MKIAILCTIFIMLSCAQTGRIIHTDNQDLFKGDPTDSELRKSVLHVLVSNNLIAEADHESYIVNINESGRMYFVELWPKEKNSLNVIGVKLKKRTLAVVEIYTPCQIKTVIDTNKTNALDSLIR